ncbi:helix-turn-helix domain-containing protein [Polymorphospora rubra]|uniref:helix-turn-helix domain-containing protein n=1 Tax=Polymorphospora rubra TaxID=338584 RepID=UPI0033C99C68
MGRTSLGDYLAFRRARINPQSTSLVTTGRWRRVPGLRREEVAQLAGVSTAYYTRLEQGVSATASAQVLDALARALQLDAAERAHLHDLAQTPTARRTLVRPRPEEPHPRSLALLGAIEHLPALLFGRRTDILAWNRLGHALLASHLPFEAPGDPEQRPNMARLLFLDPYVQRVHRNLEQAARVNVGYLRLVSGRHPDDARLAELIGELAMSSDLFASLWTARGVRECTHGIRDLDHAIAGPLSLTYQVWSQPDHPDHRIEVYTAEPDSSSERALTRLADATRFDHSPAKGDGISSRPVTR